MESFKSLGHVSASLAAQQNWTKSPCFNKEEMLHRGRAAFCLGLKGE